MGKNSDQRLYRHMKWKNSELNKFISENRMTKEDRKNGIHYADWIFDCLKNRGSFGHRIDRVRLVGSVGKGTALRGSDFDLVVFVNEKDEDDDYECPLFTRVLQSFICILANLRNSNLENLRMRKRYHYNSIGFKIHGYNFDLLPATNFGQSKKEQLDEVLEHIGALEDPMDDNYLFSTSLCESTVEFVKCQPQFIHDVIILAKIWNKSIKGIEYISGRSYLIELVAICANKGKRMKNILTGFVRFLECMRDFDDICVEFYKYYDEDDVPQSVLDDEPLVLDPVNPWNNLAYEDNITATEIEMFSDAAQWTLDRLVKFGYKRHLDVNDIFQPYVFDYSDYESVEYDDESDN